MKEKGGYLQRRWLQRRLFVIQESIELKPGKDDQTTLCDYVDFVARRSCGFFWCFLGFSEMLKSPSCFIPDFILILICLSLIRWILKYCNHIRLSPTLPRRFKLQLPFLELYHLRNVSVSLNCLLVAITKYLDPITWTPSGLSQCVWNSSIPAFSNGPCPNVTSASRYLIAYLCGWRWQSTCFAIHGWQHSLQCFAK